MGYASFWAVWAIVVGCLVVTGGAGAQDNGEPPLRPLVLGAPLTHPDWMLRDVPWGPEGVKHMLDACKACGWTRVYWRALDGGRALYKSALMDPQGRWDEDNFWHPVAPEDVKLTEQFTSGMSAENRQALLDRLQKWEYSEFDTLREAVRYGHEIGLEVHAWLSINEDDHGWGLESRFSKAHKETRWRKRDGTLYRSQQSFAYPEVMEYKLGIVAEILDNYEVDGLFLDWIRTGDVRDDPQNDADGVADRGYEEPLVKKFTELYGADPHTVPNGDERWVRLRAEPHTEFMRGVRALVDKKRPGKPVAAMVMQPWGYRGLQNKIDGNLRGMLLDVRTWAREGLVDSVVAAGYYMNGGNSELAYKALEEETEGKAEVWLYAWVPTTTGDVWREFGLADGVGAKQILFWEADYIDGREKKEELQSAMRTRAAGLK
ncbi:MAG: family 10 glycosylhydrolase [bacterium]|nr:family 10 glycosylhydrolase [bacterium]